MPAWSKISACENAILRPGFLDADIYKRAGLQSFTLNRVNPDDEVQLKHALVPWVELMGRDPIDPAVQAVLAPLTQMAARVVGR